MSKKDKDKERAGRGESSGEAPSPSKEGVESVSTNDPGVLAEAESRESWRGEPGSTIAVETSRVGEPPAAVVPRRPADPPRDRENGRRAEDEEREDRKDREDRKNQGDRASVRPSGWMPLLIVAAASLVFGMAGAWGYMHFLGPKNPDSSQGSKSDDSGGGGSGGGGDSRSKSRSKGSAKSGGASGSDSASEIPGFTSAKDADTLTKQIQHISGRIDQLNQRIDRMDGSRGEPPSGLRTLQVKVGELAREVDDLAGLPADLGRLEEAIEGLKLQVQAGRATDTPPAAPSTPKMTVPRDVLPPAARSSANDPAVIDLRTMPEAALRQGMERFRRGEYAEARDVFRKLTEDHPEDARAWYFEALANGLASGSWGGETARLVREGLAREQAGTPSTAAIDGALAGLGEVQGRDWLRAYRSRIARR